MAAKKKTKKPAKVEASGEPCLPGCVLPKGHRSDEHGDDHQDPAGGWWNQGKIIDQAHASPGLFGVSNEPMRAGEPGVIEIPDLPDDTKLTIGANDNWAGNVGIPATLSGEGKPPFDPPMPPDALAEKLRAASAVPCSNCKGLVLPGRTCRFCGIACPG